MFLNAGSHWYNQSLFNVVLFVEGGDVKTYRWAIESRFDKGMLTTTLTVPYYVAICFAALIALPMAGPWIAIIIAVVAMLARYLFGPLNGKQPAGGHGMIDGLVAIWTMFANIAVIVMAVVRLSQA